MSQRTMLLLAVLAALVPVSLVAQDESSPRTTTDSQSASFVPQLINYQGQLTDASGNPANGTFTMIFRIFNSATGGSAQYTETQSVTVSNGVFSVLLGSVTPIPFSIFTSGTERFLEITVSGTTLTPRRQFTAVPYAIRANTADGVADGAIVTADLADNAVTSAKIANGAVQNQDLANNAVTANKIADAQVVKSLNTLKDDVTLAAGSNVSISTSGNTLTISATPGGGGGDITAVNAGTGLAGGGTSGNVTLSLDQTFTDNRYVNEGQVESVSSAMIQNSTIVNADVSPSAAIAGTKVVPDFGSQTILTTGSAGIGTTNPDHKLTIDVGPLNQDNGIHLISDASARDLRIQIEYDDAGNASHFIFDDGSDGHTLDIESRNALAFNTGTDQERMRITSSGNVGVGTTSPNARFAVQQGSSGLGAGRFEITNAGNSNPAMQASTNGSGSAVSGTAQGTGSAGSFAVTNSANLNPAVAITTNAMTNNVIAARALDVLHTGRYLQMANFESTVDAQAGNDLVQIRATATSSNTSQFIEAERGTDVEFRVDGDGNVFADGAFTSPADFSEMIEVAGGQATAEPGDVMLISTSQERAVEKSNEAGSTRVFGIYSGKPGFIGSEREWDAPGANGGEAQTFTVEYMKQNFNEVPVAIMGIVPCKVSAENGAIRPGDLLITSRTPGHAMKAPENPRAGSVVGKALGSLNAGTGLVKVYVTVR